MASVASSDNGGSGQVVVDVHENTTPADFVSIIQYFTGQISELNKDYNNRRDDIVKASTIWLAFHGAVTTVLFSSAGKSKESIKCDDFWNTLILLVLFLSSLVSLATMVFVLYNFLKQLKLLKLEIRYQRERCWAADYCLQNPRFTSQRIVFSTYRREFAVYENRVDACWWIRRFAFIVSLMLFSATFVIFGTRLLCAQ